MGSWNELIERVIVADSKRRLADRRTRMATAAMQAFISVNELAYDDIARISVAMADALITELDKEAT